MAEGSAVAQASRKIGVTEQIFYRWRAEYGGLRIDQGRRLKQLEAENARLRRAVADLTLDNQILNVKGGAGELLITSRRRQCVERIREVLGLSERRACKVLGQPLSTQRYKPVAAADERDQHSVRSVWTRSKRWPS